MSINVYKINRTLVSEGNVIRIPVSFMPTQITVRNLTRQVTLPTSSGVLTARWHEGSSANTITESASSSATGLTAGNLTSNGITVVEGNQERFGAPIAYASSSTTNPAVITTSAAHGLNVGQRILIQSSSTAKQVEGMEFTVTAVGSTTTLTLGYLDGRTSGNNAVGTALGTGNIVPVNFDDPALPAINYVTSVTTTNPKRPVFRFGLTITNYVVGQQITFSGFDTFGMTQINGQTGVITAISTTNNTVTCDLDTTGFSAFDWPASSDAGGQRPIAYPKGQIDSTTFDAAFEHVTTPYILLGTGVVGSDNDVLVLEAEAITL